MPTYELINPSDAYTFIAPNIEVAGVAVAMLSTAYGARDVATDESTPILFGWDEWLTLHGIDDAWMIEHTAEIAAALESVLIGDAAARADVETTLSHLPHDQRQAWLDERHDRRRTSLSDIGSRAHWTAQRLKLNLQPKGIVDGKAS